MQYAIDITSKYVVSLLLFVSYLSLAPSSVLTSPVKLVDSIAAYFHDDIISFLLSD